MSAIKLNSDKPTFLLPINLLGDSTPHNMKTSTAERFGYVCPQPECHDQLTHDIRERGFVRHKTNPDCDYERGERDHPAVSEPSSGTSSDHRPIA